VIASALLKAVLVCVSLASAGIAVADTLSSQYTYDANGRLRTAKYGSTKCVIYTFDANGNRTRQNTASVNSASPPAGETNSGGATATAGPADAIWGSGTWGCFDWGPP